MTKWKLTAAALLIALAPATARAQNTASAAPAACAAPTEAPAAAGSAPAADSAMPAASAAPVAATEVAPAPTPAPTTTITAMPATASTDIATIEKRVADLEAYVNNGAQSDAATTKVPGPGPDHNGWMMVCAALVLFMTLPGLALFYGGLVRQKNVLSVMAQCLGLAGLVALMCWAFGYSMAFSKGNAFMGNMTFAFLNGVDSKPNTDYAYWISQNVFSMYQLMFAIITPALIVGAIAEHMKYSALMLFLA